MGNIPAKKQKAAEEELKKRKEEILIRVFPPWDRSYARWLARDLERIHGFAPVHPRALKPPDHYIEIMRLNGWLDVDLDDPEISHLFKN